jgi:hypothetical protein
MAAFDLTTISDLDRERVARDNNIVIMLAPYPIISRALQANDRTLDLLSAKGGIIVAHGKPTLDYVMNGPKSGGGPTAWLKFTNGITTFLLNTVDNDTRWTDVARQVANFIHQDYLAQLPMWPATGCEQRCYVVLNQSAKLTVGIHQIYWSASGNILCVDKATATHFTASVYGKPTLKGLCVNAARMQVIESALAQQGAATMTPQQLHALIESKAPEALKVLSW